MKWNMNSLPSSCNICNSNRRPHHFQKSVTDGCFYSIMVKVPQKSNQKNVVNVWCNYSTKRVRPSLRAIYLLSSVAYPGILFGGGSTNSVEDRENGDLGAVAP